MKTQKSNPTRRQRGGFTLLELMVAMGISITIVTILVQITAIATDTWTRSRAEIRASRQAKAMLDTMAKDFEALVSRSGNSSEYLYAGIDSDAMVPAAVRNKAEPNVAELSFFTAATDRYLGQIGKEGVDKGGDVSCVSYQMRYRDPIEGESGDDDNATFVLFRRLVDPDVTFENLLGKDDLETAVRSISGDVDEEENFICENVHQFTVTFLVEVSRRTGGSEGTVEVETVRVPLGLERNGEFRLKGTGIVLQNIEVDGAELEEIEAGRLKGVDISITVLSDAGVARLGDEGLTDTDYQRNSFNYSRIIEVPSM